MVATSTPISGRLNDTSDEGMLFSRSQVISRILELNPTITVSFLASFSDESLGHYLARLNVAQQPRPVLPGRGQGWIRVGGVPAILCRESDDSPSS
jgi:hypothetical protein